MLDRLDRGRHLLYFYSNSVRFLYFVTANEWFILELKLNINLIVIFDIIFKIGKNVATVTLTFNYYFLYKKNIVSKAYSKIIIDLIPKVQQNIETFSLKIHTDMSFFEIRTTRVPLYKKIFNSKEKTIPKNSDRCLLAPNT